MGDGVDVHIGRRICRRRKSLGLTQHQLAHALGVCFQQVYKYECGASRIVPARLWALSRTLGVEVGYFFEGLPRERGERANHVPVRAVNESSPRQPRGSTRDAECRTG
jgi:transcriptional regulator with XRE-family HTH domain